jgi:hypothetical protein
VETNRGRRTRCAVAFVDAAPGVEHDGLLQEDSMSRRRLVEAMESTNIGNAGGVHNM